MLINNEIKILTHREIIDRSTEQIGLVCKELKLWIHPNFWRPNSLFTYSSK